MYLYLKPSKPSKRNDKKLEFGRALFQGLTPLFLSFLRFEDRAKKDQSVRERREQEKAGGLGREKQIHSKPGLGALGLCYLTSECLYRKHFQWCLVPILSPTPAHLQAELLSWTFAGEI